MCPFGWYAYHRLSQQGLAQSREMLGFSDQRREHTPLPISWAPAGVTHGAHDIFCRTCIRAGGHYQKQKLWSGAKVTMWRKPMSGEDRTPRFPFVLSKSPVLGSSPSGFSDGWRISHEQPSRSAHYPAAFSSCALGHVGRHLRCANMPQICSER